MSIHSWKPSPIHVSIGLSQIAFPIIVLPKDDNTNSFQEERLGLPYWTMIQAICVVIDESKMSGHSDWCPNSSRARSAVVVLTSVSAGVRQESVFFEPTKNVNSSRKFVFRPLEFAHFVQQFSPGVSLQGPRNLRQMWASQQTQFHPRAPNDILEMCWGGGGGRGGRVPLVLVTRNGKVNWKMSDNNFCPCLYENVASRKPVSFWTL